MKLSLTPKLVLVFILFAVMLLSGVGTLAHSTGQAAFEASAVTELDGKRGGS